MAIKQFEEEEACSTRDGKYSMKLWSTMIDSKWKPGGFVSLPDVGTLPSTFMPVRCPAVNSKTPSDKVLFLFLRAAKVYDGGSHYKDCDVTCSFDDVTGIHLTYIDVVGAR